MQKLSTRRVMGSKILKGHQLTIGLDLGDRWSFYGVLNERARSFGKGNYRRLLKQ
jgi:hypothetical protein